MTGSAPVRRVAVVDAGTIGVSRAAYFLERPGGPIESRLHDLGTHRASRPGRMTIDGVAEAVRGRDVAELAVERDRAAFAMLAALTHQVL